MFSIEEQLNKIEANINMKIDKKLKLEIANIFKKHAKKRKARLVLIAVAYYIVRKNGIYVPLHYFYRDTELTYKEKKFIKSIIRELIFEYGLIFTSMEKEASEMLMFLKKELKIADKYIAKTLEIIKIFLDRKSFSGNPATLVGASLLLVLNSNGYYINEVEISRILGVTECALRYIKKQILAMLDSKFLYV